MHIRIYLETHAESRMETDHFLTAFFSPCFFFSFFALASFSSYFCLSLSIFLCRFSASILILSASRILMVSKLCLVSSYRLALACSSTSTFTLAAVTASTNFLV